MKQLFEIAKKNDIEVIYMGIPSCQSMSMDGYIGIDYRYLFEGANERVHLAHELGHCTLFFCISQ